MRKTGADWTTLAAPKVLWLNTGMLILAVSRCNGREGRRSGDETDHVKTGLMAAGVFSFAFLAGQLLAWRQLNAAGYFLTSNPANAFFYLLTALHAVHLLGGLWVWGTTTAKLARGAKVGAIRLSVELCTVYWHYLLLVWLVSVRVCCCLT